MWPTDLVLTYDPVGRYPSPWFLRGRLEFCWYRSSPYSAKEWYVLSLPNLWRGWCFMFSYLSRHLDDLWCLNPMQMSCLWILPQSRKKAGAMWREAGLSWKDFLPEDEDVNKFVTEKVRGRRSWPCRDWKQIHHIVLPLFELRDEYEIIVNY